MAQGDVVYSIFSVTTNIYGTSNTSGVHLATSLPSTTYQILGSEILPAKGTGGQGVTRMLVFAMEK